MFLKISQNWQEKNFRSATLLKKSDSDTGPFVSSTVPVSRAVHLIVLRQFCYKLPKREIKEVISNLGNNDYKSIEA